MTKKIDREAIIAELKREALDDPETGWLSDLARRGLKWEDSDEIISIASWYGSVDVGHLAGVVEHLIAEVTNPLLSRLEQAEQKVASLEAKMDGENLRWVAWEMVENSGHLDLPIITWINRISDDEVSLDAAKYFFFGGKSPCIHLDSDEPFEIEDEDRHACEHCNRRALDGDGRE